MKTLICFLLLIPAALLAQNILRVNNTAGVNAPYTTIAAAVAAAGPTDIIMVEGSLTNYAPLVIDKKVTIVGPGYFLTENQNLQASALPATLQYIIVNSGALGSSFYGLSVGSASFGSYSLNSVSSITISNCYMQDKIDFAGTGNSITIKENYASSISVPGSYTGVILSNNFFSGSVDTGTTSTFIVKNNTISSGVNVQNSDLRNNIFLNSGGQNMTGSIIKNNVFFNATQTGADATNLFSQPIASLFIGLTGNTTDTQWKLKTGSPALTAGEGAIQCGMYGGLTPYRPSGIQTGKPTITNFSMPNTIPQNGTLNVKVSAKVN